MNYRDICCQAWKKLVIIINTIRTSRNLEQKLTANDAEAGQPITLQYDTQIQTSTFKNSVNKINISGTQLLQPI